MPRKIVAALCAMVLGATLLGERVADAQRAADVRRSNGGAWWADGGAKPWEHAASARAQLAEARADFLAAWESVEPGGPELAAQDSENLRAYPLYPYLEAARIAAALARAQDPRTAADAHAEAFLARHADEPVARMLVRARLESLARREQWRELLVAARAASDDDAWLRCVSLRARIALDDIEGLAPEILDLWLTDRQLPLECEPVFQWLRGEGLLTDDLVERRVRLLLESGQAAFARVIARRLPRERAAPFNLWADLLERPLETLDALLDGDDKPLPDGALEAGWRRLTRDRPLDALARYEALVDRFALDARARSRAALALALGLAWDRRTEALDYFARVSPEDLDDYALGWLARAALWAGDWRLVEKTIERMSSETRDETRWRYWAARAAEATGERERARELYRAILPRDNYYSAMAAARLGMRATPRHRPVPPDQSRLARLETLPPFVRARELYFSRLPWLATLEWQHGSAELDADDGLQTIHLAMRWGWYDLGVATATARQVYDDYRLLYPTPYDAEVLAAAERTGIDPTLLYAVIRQESLFRPDAASAAGALGLAQLKPDTARRAARRLGLPAPKREDLLVPATNVLLGAAELAALLDEFRGQLPVALAGYNAGPRAARRWLPQEPLDADIWIENIPYNETRSYVQRVLWHSVVFAWLDSGEARDTREWLVRVGPADDDRELHADSRP
ncbi:MAG: transglycosylase SLT domain-containing protein [Gammaproteobacteria bacterium]